MRLNGFDVDTATGTRQVELRLGDLPGLGLDLDLLVVSAFEPHIFDPDEIDAFKREGRP